MVPRAASRRTGPLATRGGLAAAAVIATIAVLALAGCSPSPSTGPSNTPSPSKSGSSGPGPNPTPTFAALNYNCDSILPPATLTIFKSKAGAGFELQPDYLTRMQNIDSNLVAFNTYGGILCQWAYPDASSSVDYAFSPITAAQTTTQQAALSTNGYVGSSKDHGTLYVNTDTTDYPDEYLFISGYWFQASSDNVMQLLVDNVFVNP
jgi:hypothetical protein